MILECFEKPISPPDDVRLVVYECDECGEPIREGDGFYLLSENCFCENCVERNFNYAEFVNPWED